jgi:hypothetical protein
LFKLFKNVRRDSRPIGRTDGGAGLRDILGDQCPLCSKALFGHRAGMVASFPLPGELDSAIENVRQRFLAAAVTELPRDPAHGADAVQYWLLACPVSGALAVLEVASRIEVFAPDFANVLRGLPPDKVRELTAGVLRWWTL